MMYNLNTNSLINLLSKHIKFVDEDKTILMNPLAFYQHILHAFYLLPALKQLNSQQLGLVFHLKFCHNNYLIILPSDVNPGHITFAPPKICLIAPVSICY